MRKAINGLSALGIAGCIGLNAQDAFLEGVEIKRNWLLWLGAVALLLVLLLSTDKATTWMANKWKRPIIAAHGISDYWRTAIGSPTEPDLQIV